MKPALYQSSLIQLAYDADFNILIVKWVNKIAAPFTEILDSYRQLVNCINQHQVTKLLIDSREDICGEEEENLEILKIQFFVDLAGTRLRKVARILPEREEVNLLADAHEPEAPFKLPFIFEKEQFTNQESALIWLNSEND